LNYNSGLAKNVHYGDVLIKFGELLDVEKDEVPYITDDTLSNKFKSSKLQNGDVIIADAAEDETVGKCTELVNVGEEIVISGLHTIPCRPTLSFASGYLGYFMNSPAYHNQLLRLMQGTKVSSISKSALQNTVIFYPFDILEQKKISELFQQLNSLITLHQRKLFLIMVPS
jgi:type I restriction enzyme S subunit